MGDERNVGDDDTVGDERNVGDDTVGDERNVGDELVMLGEERNAGGLDCVGAVKLGDVRACGAKLGTGRAAAIPGVEPKLLRDESLIARGGVLDTPAT